MDFHNPKRRGVLEIIFMGELNVLHEVASIYFSSQYLNVILFILYEK